MYLSKGYMQEKLVMGWPMMKISRKSMQYNYLKLLGNNTLWGKVFIDNVLLPLPQVKGRNSGTTLSMKAPPNTTGRLVGRFFLGQVIHGAIVQVVYCHCPAHTSLFLHLALRSTIMGGDFNDAPPAYLSTSRPTPSIVLKTYIFHLAVHSLQKGNATPYNPSKYFSTIDNFQIRRDYSTVNEIPCYGKTSKSHQQIASHLVHHLQNSDHQYKTCYKNE